VLSKMAATPQIAVVPTAMPKSTGSLLKVPVKTLLVKTSTDSLLRYRLSNSKGREMKTS
jgi:hypothetical protein